MRPTKEETKIRLDADGPEADRWTVLADESAERRSRRGKTIAARRKARCSVALGQPARCPSGFRRPRSRRIVAHARSEIEGQDQPGTFIGARRREPPRRHVEARRAGDDHAVFRRALPQWGLEITKTYRLVKVPAGIGGRRRFSGLSPGVSRSRFATRATRRTRVAYRLDGPNGLPKEGAWYASKVSRNWGGSGLRDFIVSFGAASRHMVSGLRLAAGKSRQAPGRTTRQPLNFIGVDAQYFSAVLIPERKNPEDVWFDQLMPIRVGKVEARSTRTS